LHANAIQHDEEVNPDPFAFRPESFLKDGKLDPRVQDPEIAAFGLGRRICPGRYMALDSVWITVVSILGMFSIEKAIDEDGKVIEPGRILVGWNQVSDTIAWNI
jgi:cytochrome P450